MSFQAARKFAQHNGRIFTIISPCSGRAGSALLPYYTTGRYRRNLRVAPTAKSLLVLTGILLEREADTRTAMKNGTFTAPLPTATRDNVAVWLLLTLASPSALNKVFDPWVTRRW